jgi:hypothetical protein
MKKDYEQFASTHMHFLINKDIEWNVKKKKKVLGTYFQFSILK